LYQQAEVAVSGARGLQRALRRERDERRDAGKIEDGLRRHREAIQRQWFAAQPGTSADKRRAGGDAAVKLGALLFGDS
jgi:hypothetical protein